MADYPYRMQLVVDPDNPRNVVAAGSVSIYDSEDTGKTTLLPLTDPSGVPIPNPITSNSQGFTPPFVTTSPEVLWVSGPYEDYFQSYKGMRDEAVGARGAAEAAAANAATSALAELEARIAAGEFKGEKGADGANVLPTDTAIKERINDPASETRGALNATYAKVKSVDAKYGDGILDATAHIQSVIDAANTASVGVYVPAGVYKVTAPLENVRRLRLAEGAKITASAAGMAAVLRTQEATRWDSGYIVGKGAVDANTNAAIGVHVRNFLYFEINGIEVNGGNTAALKLGSSTAAGRSAEAIVSNVRLINNGTVVADQRGILVENSGDHSFSQILIQNYNIGMTLPVAGNAMVHDVHVWSDPVKGSTRISFEDYSNNTHYTGCHADTPTEYGWRLYGYGVTLVQCGTYNNHTASYATDNLMVGVKFEGANAIGFLVGHFFLGGSAAKRLKADIEAADGKYGLIQNVGCTNQHTVTVRSLYNRAIGSVTRDTVTAGTGFAADAATPTADLGLSIKTGGLDRWKFVSDGAAESGANAGSGLSLRRYSDAGALLSDPVFISRSSGTWVWKTAQSILDGNNIVFGTGTGTQIGTGSTQKLAFYGNTPVVKPAALTAEDASVIDSTYGAEEAAVLANLKLRVKQLETRLQLLGLIG